jgi:hypothetical protein
LLGLVAGFIGRALVRGGLLSALIGVIIVLLLAGLLTRKAGIETPRDRRRRVRY